MNRSQHARELYEQARAIHETVLLLKTRIIAEHMAFMSEHDLARSGMELTIPQMNMLAVIRNGQPIPLKAVAKALHVSAPSASSMVERLVEMGAVTRKQNPADRREVVISITDRAEVVLDKMEDHILESIVDLLDRLGSDYARKWCDVYSRLHELLESQPLPETRVQAGGREVV